MQGRVVHSGEGHGFHRGVGRARNLGGLRLKAGGRLPFLRAFDAIALDQGIAEQVAGQGVHLFAAQGRGGVLADAVLHRGIDAQAFSRQTQHQSGRVPRRAGFVVRDAGAKAHFHEPLRGLRQRQRGKRRLLQNGVVPDAFVQQALHLGRVQTVHGKDLGLPHGGHGQVEILAQPQGRLTPCVSSIPAWGPVSTL